MRIWKLKSALAVWVFAGISIYAFQLYLPLMEAASAGIIEERAKERAAQIEQFERDAEQYYKILGMPS